MSTANSVPGDTSYEPLPTSPRWFVDNIRNQGVSRFATAEGKKVHFLGWNLDNESLPVLMFVHGFAGNAHWWSYLMPFFADHYRVVAIDLPGMGDSEGLDEYDDECFARGILGVIREYQLAPLTIVGHSYGGIQSMYAMTLAPELFNQGIIIDCNLWFPQQRPAGVEITVKPHKQYPTRDDCMSRFSLMPKQPQAPDYLMHYVSYHACTRDRDGWRWKADYMIRTANLITDANLLTRIPVKVDCIFGQRSLYNKPDLDEQVHRVFPNFGQLVRIADAYHHIAMDHPLELVEAIRRLLNGRPRQDH